MEPDAQAGNDEEGEGVMNVLVACEFSGVVREAFLAKGHNCFSCDLLPSEHPSPYHFQIDVLDLLNMPWDMLIGFPPCTDLAVSGARWWKQKGADRINKASMFFMELATARIPKIAIENPIGFMSTCWRKPDQIIQPWWFGHGETKATCLWLKNLPKLLPTEIVDGREDKIHKMPPSKDRWKNRSRTYQGIADAMADQWGGLS